MIKTWQERLGNQYTYPSFEVCKAMEEEIAELRAKEDLQQIALEERASKQQMNFKDWADEICTLKRVPTWIKV